jgi:hypothetical protein
MTRPLLRTGAVTALTAVLVALATPPTAGGDGQSPADLSPAELLPPCPPASAATRAPGAPPSLDLPSLGDPTACRAEPTRVEPAGAGLPPAPRPGYHHLGATTAGTWSGILGRLTVRDTGVRAGSFDFVATRFLAKQREAGSGGLTWLEVGWAETGWSGEGAARVYAFDSEAMSWVFFDEYPLRDGDQVWVYLHSGLQDRAGGTVTWQAWLWWGERWRLLAAPELPMAEAARLEQYVEVHLDPRGGRLPFPVPPIQVDQVRLAAAPGAPLVSWGPEQVPTVTPRASTHYCLAWQQPYHAWSAGDCPTTVQG